MILIRPTRDDASCMDVYAPVLVARKAWIGPGGSRPSSLYCTHYQDDEITVINSCLAPFYPSFVYSLLHGVDWPRAGPHEPLTPNRQPTLDSDSRLPCPCIVTQTRREVQRDKVVVQIVELSAKPPNAPPLRDCEKCTHNGNPEIIETRTVGSTFYPCSVLVSCILGEAILVSAACDTCSPCSRYHHEKCMN